MKKKKSTNIITLVTTLSLLIFLNTNSTLKTLLKNYFNQDNLESIDGRTMAAAFRRFDILLRYLND